MRSIYNLFSCSVLLCATGLAQTIGPSNSTDLLPTTSYPRFSVRPASSLHFPSFEVAPLAQYAAITRQYFISLRTEGRIVDTYLANGNQVQSRDISYVSCDPEDYDGHLGPVDLLSIITTMNVKNTVIFYTRTADHCDASGFTNGWLPRLNGIYTTLDPVAAEQVANLHFHHEANALAYILPDDSTYTDASAPFFNQSSVSYDSGPTTAVAMIVLYSITGIITALFVSIIVTGAIRAHLHPERYGPRAGSNTRGRQSRAKGIARAVLETIPIVKFGDQHKSDTKKGVDVEMMPSTPGDKALPADSGKKPSVAVKTSTKSASVSSPSNADGSDELGVLGCSICTEEFQKGEEVRVLPCNHKYHPDCVDPWLLNVSGTCPLCRIDLRGPDDDNELVDPMVAIPANTSNIHVLRSAITGTRDERIAALRRFRIERRSRDETTQAQTQNEEERRGLARRLTDRFRIRTRRHEGVTNDTTAR